MILAAAVEGTERFVLVFRRGCLDHPVMAMHRGFDGLRRLPKRMAHAMHGFRLGYASQCQRPADRNEHDEQQKFGSPAMHGGPGVGRAERPDEQSPTL
jgi:hypothetical protein